MIGSMGATVGKTPQIPTTITSQCTWLMRVLVLCLAYSCALRPRSISFSTSTVGMPRPSTRLSVLDVKKAVDMIHEQVVLSQIVGQFTSIKQNGPNSFLCLCPFHSDSNPSMGISDDKGLYHCFSCGAGGDVIKFVREMEQLSFTEAIIKTLSLSGLGNASSLAALSSPADLQLSKEEIEQFRRRARIEETLQRAADFYASKLLGDVKAGAARTHLINRRIRPQTAFRFQLGYAPAGGSASLTANLTASGFSIDELVSAGLTIKGDRDRPLVGGAASAASLAAAAARNNAENNFDRFRDRLMVPIFNAQGKVVAFGGRLLEAATPSKPKYMNSPETSIFKKSNTLFGFDVARKAIASEGVAVIVEGYFDVIALHDAGVETAVGAMGTSLTKEQIAGAARLSKGKVILMFDADEAGQLATQRVIENVLPAVLATTTGAVDLRIASLPPVPDQKNGKKEKEPKDPADVCLRLGAGAGAAMQNAVSKAVGWKQWSVDRIILTGLRELDDKTQVSEQQSSYTESPPSSFSSSSHTATHLSISDQEDRAEASPMMAALGLDSIRPPPVASMASLMSAPDVFASTVAALARFLASLSNASDRTILAYYCAERLAGGRPSMRVQLENDLLASSKKIHEAGVASNKPAAPIVGAPPSSPLLQEKAGVYAARWSRPPPGVTLQPTSSLPPKITTSLIFPAVAAVSPEPPTPPTVAARASTPSNEHSSVRRLATPTSTGPLQQSSLPKGNGNIANASDVNSLISSGIDITVPIASPYTRKYKAPEPSKFWEDFQWAGCLNAQVQAKSDTKPPALALGDTRGRVLGAELKLLTVFVTMPMLRDAVRAAKTRIELTPGASLDMWSHAGHGELWCALCSVDEEPESYQDMASRVQQIVDPSSAASAALRKILTQGVEPHAPAQTSDLTAEFSIAVATQTLCESRVKSRLVSLLHDGAGEKEGMGIASNTSSSTNLDEAGVFSFDLTGKQERLVELFEAENRRQKIDSMLESVSVIERDEGEVGDDFLLQLQQHAAGDEHPLPLGLTMNDEAVKGGNRYSFDFHEDQLDDRILAEGKMSDEEMYETERQAMQEEASRQDSKRRGGKGAPSSPGFTIGLDEDQLYEPTTAKWRKK